MSNLNVLSHPVVVTSFGLTKSQPSAGRSGTVSAKKLIQSNPIPGSSSCKAKQSGEGKLRLRKVRAKEGKASRSGVGKEGGKKSAERVEVEVAANEFCDDSDWNRLSSIAVNYCPTAANVVNKGSADVQDEPVAGSAASRVGGGKIVPYTIDDVDSVYSSLSTYVLACSDRRRIPLSEFRGFTLLVTIIPPVDELGVADVERLSSLRQRMAATNAKMKLEAKPRELCVQNTQKNSLTVEAVTPASTVVTAASTAPPATPRRGMKMLIFPAACLHSESRAAAHAKAREQLDIGAMVKRCFLGENVFLSREVTATSVNAGSTPDALIDFLQRETPSDNASAGCACFSQVREIPIKPYTKFLVSAAGVPVKRYVAGFYPTDGMVSSCQTL